MAAFHPELVGSDADGFLIKVELGSSDRQTVAVLDVLERHVTAQDEGPAHVELDGRRYTMHAR